MAEPAACGSCGARAWANASGELLACTGCGAAWPGEPLPSPDPPVGRRPSRPAGFVPWGRRVDRMVAELRDLEAGGA